MTAWTSVSTSGPSRLGSDSQSDGAPRKIALRTPRSLTVIFAGTRAEAWRFSGLSLLIIKSIIRDNLHPTAETSCGEEQLHPRHDQHDRQQPPDRERREAVRAEPRAPEPARERDGGEERRPGRHPPGRREVPEEPGDRVREDEGDRRPRRPARRLPAGQDQRRREEDAAADAGQARQQPEARTDREPHPPPRRRAEGGP